MVAALLALASLPLYAVSGPPEYRDPAMTFVAPSDYVQMAVPPHDPTTFEQPTVVAAFVKNGGTSDAVTITIEMQNFDGRAAGFEQNMENQMREAIDGAFIRKDEAPLRNGMPAYWVKVTMGTGFNQATRWQYEWADGLRGVVLSVVSRAGTITEQQARDALANVSAVAYPMGRYY